MNRACMCPKAIALALYLGAAVISLRSAWWVLKKTPWLTTFVEVGAWKANLLAGGLDAEMYTRTPVALNAVLALGRHETIYFLATENDAARPLRSHCSYRVEGTPPQVRWSGIAAHTNNLFLFDVPNRQFSLNGTSAVLNADGKFVVTTGPQASSEGFWLTTPDQTHIILAPHLLAVWTTPRFFMQKLMNGPIAQSMEMHNNAAFPPPVMEQLHTTVMPSSDLLYSVYMFGVSQEPVRVKAHPQLNSYSLIALYVSNTDNFFVMTSKTGLLLMCVFTGNYETEKTMMEPVRRRLSCGMA